MRVGSTVVLCTGLMLLAPLSGVPLRGAAVEVDTESMPVLMGSDGRELPFTDRSALLEYMRSAPEISSELIGQGITQAERLLIEQDGIVAQVAFHDVDTHEQRMKRLPNGKIVLYVKDSFNSQIAAYELSCLLGLDNVPPTVERRRGSTRGSAQLWIENAVTEERRREENLQPPDHNLWNQQYADMRVFDNLINNIDRNQGNLLLDPEGKLWMIDHTRSFGRDKTLPRPELITRCSRGLFERLRALEPDRVGERLSPYLRKSEIAALFARRDKLVALIEEKITSEGEDRVLFDSGAPDSDVVIRESSVGSEPPNR